MKWEDFDLMSVVVDLISLFVLEEHSQNGFQINISQCILSHHGAKSEQDNLSLLLQKAMQNKPLYKSPEGLSNDVVEQLVACIS